MEKKNFLEIFSKYLPPSEYVDILLSAKNIRSRADKEKRILEIRLELDELVPKKTLYSIEDGLCKAYKLNIAKILPQYPSELFSYDYIPEILKETEEIGVVARGFFSDYDYKLDLSDNFLEIEIPFGIGGIKLLEDANTPRVIENIIKSEFSISSHVSISHREFGGSEYREYHKQRLAEIDKQIKNADRAYSAASSSSNVITNDEDKPKFPRIATVYDEGSEIFYNDEGFCHIGANVYDISSPEYRVGDEFEIKPVVISSLTKPVRNVVNVHN